jgi:hypothetical protein
MATTTITTTTAEDQRLVVAFGTYLGLGRNANQSEIKQYLIKTMNDIVVNQEERANVIALTPPAPISPT